ncbi:MAG: PHP domain-containing protein [Ruminococcaceae bacterium]|nr:PHP domain-containing protein [Oscillospiraceae bacterium]
MRVYCDLHLHSCLSPCGDEDMTPWNLVNMAKILGLDLIALTDHNSCGNCRSAMKVGELAGITVVPGMELCTAEEIHCVCLFDDIDRAEAFSSYVRTTLPPVKNREEIFGRQLYMDEGDTVLESEEVLLTTASSISIDALPTLMKEYGGVCFPAHIDRESYSVLSSLGDFPPELEVTAFELTPVASEEDYRKNYPALEGKRLFRSSDAHYLENMREKEFYIELEENTPSALIEYIKRSV